MQQWLGTLVLVGAVSTPCLVVAVLTGIGQRRRGGRWWQVLLAVALFPLAWVIWYVQDGGLGGPRLEAHRP